MIFIEFDLAGAEWVVVAYLSGDRNMIDVVESGKSPHVATAALISSAPEELILAEHKIVGSITSPTEIAALRIEHVPELLDLQEKDAIFLPRSMSLRQMGKKSNHGLNYGMKYRRAALEWEILEAEAMPIVEYYSTVAYPGIPEWWKATRTQMGKDRTLTNCFGRKVRLLGEKGSDLYDQAYSFVPQSTVVDICLQAMCQAFEDRSIEFVPWHLGAQVHDSLMIQVPTHDWLVVEAICAKVIKYMSPELEYNGHKFTLGVDIKVGLNWGDMRSVKKAEDIRGVYEALVAGAALQLLPEVSSAEPEAEQTLDRPAPAALQIRSS
jgi:DNA polymerase I-like protein with 3'-5' exonuclease and polymerase domains